MRLRTPLLAPVSISFTPEQGAMLDALAAALNVSRSEVVRVFIEFGERFLNSVDADTLNDDESAFLAEYLDLNS